MSKTRLDSIIIDYGIMEINYNGQEILGQVCKIQVG